MGLFILGFFVGAGAGIFIMCMLQISKGDNE